MVIRLLTRAVRALRYRPALRAGNAKRVARATENVFLYVLLPGWLIPGIVDYAYHRRTKIERTSGTHEALLHALMMSAAGAPVLLGLFLEIDATVIGTMFACLVAHEALTLWDVEYAFHRRFVSPGEQHTHSFLEVLPVMNAGSARPRRAEAAARTAAESAAAPAGLYRGHPHRGPRTRRAPLYGRGRALLPRGPHVRCTPSAGRDAGTALTNRAAMNISADALKRAAGEAAVDRFVRDGMCIGLGTGSTALWAIRRVAEMIEAGAAIVAVPTSVATQTLCGELGIPLVPFLSRPIAVAIDGADEVAPDFSLTKGGGGALFREKCVALAADRFVVVVDESKLVSHLGRFPTPVEVVPFGLPWVRAQMERSFPGIRMSERGADRGYRTDNGNAILDCTFGELASPRELDARLKTLHGVVATGLFWGIATDVIVAGKDGVRDLQRAQTT
ncbi:MAG: hypothetical protein NVSMB64_15910 [Candidatus Velthaea sp.]